MSTSLRRGIDNGDYHVDPDAVAEAMLRRARAARMPLVPSQVLIPVDLFEDSTVRPDKLHALPFEDCA